MAITEFKNFINESGLRKKDLAREMGLEPHELSRILSETRVPTLTQAAGIERVTGIPASSWVTEAA